MGGYSFLKRHYRESKECSSYVDDIRKIKFLSPEEEKELVQKIREQNCQSARRDLICSILPYAVSVAQKYRNRGITFSDLIGEANVAVVKSADHYRPENGNRFIGYAKESIHHRLQNSFTKNLRFNLRMLRLDYRYEGDSSLIDFFGDNYEKKQIEREEDIEYVKYLLKEANLSFRELEIIRSRYGFDGDSKTLEEVGKKFKITRERVRQIEEKALGKLRRASKRIEKEV